MRVLEIDIKEDDEVSFSLNGYVVWSSIKNGALNKDDVRSGIVLFALNMKEEEINAIIKEKLGAI